MKAYKFKLSKDYKTDFFSDVRFENDWIRIRDNEIKIRKNYAWDGCTPKLKVFDLGYLGTPDGVMNTDGLPLLYYPSLVHDAIYQFKGEIGISRSQADDLFLYMALKTGFKLSRFYYYIIRAFGWMCGKWK